MSKNIVIGNENFDSFIKDDDGYFVDKTELIYELVEADIVVAEGGNRNRTYRLKA